MIEATGDHSNLVVGVYGSFREVIVRDTEAAEFAILHTFDRWGTPRPWGPCESAVDLDDPDLEALRAWSHVHLYRAISRGDVPINAACRAIWDGLELFGSLVLTGIDVLTPVDDVAERMAERVLTSGVRDRVRDSDFKTGLLVIVADAWEESSAEWDATRVVRELSPLVGSEQVLSNRPASVLFTSRIGNPFHMVDDPPVVLHTEIPRWSVDDAAWLAEAMCVALNRSGINCDVQISIRMRPPDAV